MSEREIRQLEKAKCKAQKAGNLKEEAVVCNQLGEILARSARFREAIEEHRQELRISEGLGDVIGCAVANRKIGECFAELENYEAALKHQRRHLDLAQSVSCDLEEQRALATIGRTYLYMCEAGRASEAHGPAEEAFLKSLSIVEEKLEGKVSVVELSEMRARLFLNLGLLYNNGHDAAKCSFYIRKSVYIAEHSQLHEDLYRANSTLGSIHLRNGEHTKAIRYLEAAKECARRMKDKHMESDSYCSIGQVLLCLGDLTAGKRALKKAYRLGSQLPSDRDGVRRSLKYAIKGCHLEEALSDLGDEDQQGALSLYEQLGDLYCKIDCYHKAVDYYRMQLRCAESLGRPERERAVIHVSLAATFTDLKDYKQAVNHYQAELCLRHGNPSEECKTWLNMAQVHQDDGQSYSQVHACLSSALKCAREAADNRLLRSVLRQLLALQHKFGVVEAADTEAELQEVCRGSDGESSEEDEMENSEPFQESDLELSQSDDEDLEGYNKLVPGKRRPNRWNRRNEKGETVLHRACIDGNLKLVQCLLEKSHPINPRDYCGWTPLHEACNHGHLEIVQLLLQHGANINDPGGPMCEGITPLHDALSSGNFHVAQLLIRRGASLTQRNAKSVTPMGSLQEWVQVYGKHLDQETRHICAETENLLRDALAGRVTPVPLEAPSSLDSDLFDTEGSQSTLETQSSTEATQESTVSRRGKLRVDKRKSISLLSSSLENENTDCLRGSPPLRTSTQVNGANIHQDDLSEPLLTPLRPVKKKTRFARQMDSSDSAGLGEIIVENETFAQTFPYKREQSQISDGGIEAYQRAIKSLGSAKSRILSQSLEEPASPPPVSAPMTALVPSEQYIDDWLEDDLKESPCTRKRSRCVSPGLASEGDSDFLEQEEQTSDDPACVRNRLNERSMSLSRKRRSRQTKLTQIVDRAVIGRTKNKGPSNSSVPRLPNFVGDQILGHTTVDTRVLATTQLPAVTSPPPPAIRVRVRVNNNLFLIPVPHSDGDTRDVSWLAEQASQRYYQSCGLLPRLTLKKEGALLAPQDLILHVLQSNEEVFAEVNSWDVPPIGDRYMKACQSLAVVENQLVKKALEQQAMSPNLSLCRLSLHPRDLCPLFRALKLQTSLRQLNLSGNNLGDGEVKELLAMLSTVPSITHLNLSTNRLTHEGIRRLCSSEHATENTAFKNLEVLDLSMNPLTDGLSQPLTSLLCCCPVLSTLHLQACQLSAKFFQQYRLQIAEAFRGAVHLNTLSLSYNPLGTTGVELILKTLPHKTISVLEMKAVTVGNREGLTMDPLVRYLSQEGCVLSHLSLSSNRLTDDCVRQLSRCLPVCPSLTSLDLSGNPYVGSVGLQCLLNAVRERSSKMDHLNLTGCGIQGPIDCSSMNDLSCVLRELRLGSCHLTKREREVLSQAWPRDTLLVSRQHKLFFMSPQ
ncbi:tonsoku-like protein [Pelobates fuscus]|uniref:tonsoku-like protein n=1 Tax=Pelobates fuscus TaxID=191477 RepID=UPI002FE4783A